MLLRKSWDTHVNRIEGKMSSAGLTAHFQQSEHMKETAKKEYKKHAQSSDSIAKNLMLRPPATLVITRILKLSAGQWIAPEVNYSSREEDEKRSSELQLSGSSTCPVILPFQHKYLSQQLLLTLPLAAGLLIHYQSHLQPLFLSKTSCSSKSSFVSGPDYSDDSSDDSNIHMKAPVKNKISKPDFAKWLKGLASWRHQQPTAVESEAVKIFTGFRHGIAKKLIEDMLDGSRIAVTDSEKMRIVFKIQQAMVFLPKPNWFRLYQNLFISFLSFQVSLCISIFFQVSKTWLFIFLYSPTFEWYLTTVRCLFAEKNLFHYLESAFLKRIKGFIVNNGGLPTG